MNENETTNCYFCQEDIKAEDITSVIGDQPDDWDVDSAEAVDLCNKHQKELTKALEELPELCGKCNKPKKPDNPQEDIEYCNCGRPTKYSKEVLEQTEQYLRDYFNEELEEVVPSIEGLAAYLSVSRSSLYEWKKQDKEFSHILEDILSIQARESLNKGLKGEWNSTIVKLLLGKHGYSEKTHNINDNFESDMPEERKKKINDSLDDIL